MKLVALTGLHGAGKDTVADALPARKLAFADVLYREVAEAFGVTVEWLQRREFKEVEQKQLALIRCDASANGFIDLAWDRLTDPSGLQPRSPRQILQWWGDYRRAQDPDYFVKRTRQELLGWDWASAAGGGLISFVITDCRFPNEARMVRRLGGQIWQVVRPGHEPPRTGHASETTGDEFAPDVVIRNAGSLEDLRAKALKEWNK